MFCGFAGRNSLLAGNLAGKCSKNAPDLPFFGLPERFDRVRYQDVRHEFPVPAKAGNCRGIAGNVCREIGIGSVAHGLSLQGSRWEARRLGKTDSTVGLFRYYRPPLRTCQGLFLRLANGGRPLLAHEVRPYSGLHQPNRHGCVVGHSACQCSERQRRAPTLAQGNALGLHRKPNVSPESAIKFLKTLIISMSYWCLPEKCPSRVQLRP
jgi:hypothetical protein